MGKRQQHLQQLQRRNRRRKQHPKLQRPLLMLLQHLPLRLPAAMAAAALVCLPLNSDMASEKKQHPITRRRRQHHKRHLLQARRLAPRPQQSLATPVAITTISLRSSRLRRSRMERLTSTCRRPLAGLPSAPRKWRPSKAEALTRGIRAFRWQ
jgi:hypothetical protein